MPCDLLIWNGKNEFAHPHTHTLVQLAQTPLALRLFYDPDDFEAMQNLEREAARAFEFTQRECVRELDWTIFGHPEKWLQNLGQLSALRLSFGKVVTVALVDQVLLALSPPTTPSLCLELDEFQDMDDDDAKNAIRNLNIRKYPYLERLEFDLDKDFTDDINYDLVQQVFYCALKHKICEVVDSIATLPPAPIAALRTSLWEVRIPSLVLCFEATSPIRVMHFE